MKDYFKKSIHFNMKNIEPNSITCFLDSLNFCHLFISASCDSALFVGITVTFTCILNRAGHLLFYGRRPLGKFKKAFQTKKQQVASSDFKARKACLIAMCHLFMSRSFIHACCMFIFFVDN